MIRGVVTPTLDAIIEVHLLARDRRELRAEAVIDTGFTGFLTLPPKLILHLGLEPVGATEATLADGTCVHLPVFDGIVLWEGGERAVSILQAEGGPLLGMSMLQGSHLSIRIVEGGPVLIEQLT